MRGVLVAGLVLLAATTACAADDDDGAVPEATVAATTATTAGPTTTTLPPQTPLATGREAVDALLDRWRAGDRPGALLVAAPTAVDALFAVAPETGEARGCNTGGVNVHVSCVFRLDAGELQVRAVPTADGSGYLVDFVILGT